jgi:hypothetical protein
VNLVFGESPGPGSEQQLEQRQQLRSKRRAVLAVLVAVAMAESPPARAQAFLPPQGEGSVSVLFSDVLRQMRTTGLLATNSSTSAVGPGSR